MCVLYKTKPHSDTAQTNMAVTDSSTKDTPIISAWQMEGRGYPVQTRAYVEVIFPSDLAINDWPARETLFVNVFT